MNANLLPKYPVAVTSMRYLVFHHQLTLYSIIRIALTPLSSDLYNYDFYARQRNADFHQHHPLSIRFLSLWKEKRQSQHQRAANPHSIMTIESSGLLFKLFVT